MKISIKILFFFTLVLSLLGLFRLLDYRDTLNEQILRLHVVGNSNTLSDQEIKLSVKEEVTEFLRRNMPKSLHKAEAKQWIIENLQEIEGVANSCLRALGSADKANVSVNKEAFPMREYETFKLPSGVYDTIRIGIGEAKGRNWWCVVFPSLCTPNTTDEVRETAKRAGFSDPLVACISGDEDYEISFYFLDLLGKIENFFHFR